MKYGRNTFRGSQAGNDSSAVDERHERGAIFVSAALKINKYYVGAAV